MAGAVSTGAAIRAAEVLGADLAYVCARFIATKESVAPDAYKQMLIDAGVNDVVYARTVKGMPASWLTASLREVGIDPANIPPPPATSFLAEGKTPWRDIWSGGQGVGLVEDIPSVKGFGRPAPARICRGVSDPGYGKCGAYRRARIGGEVGGLYAADRRGWALHPEAQPAGEAHALDTHTFRELDAQARNFERETDRIGCVMPRPRPSRPNRPVQQGNGDLSWLVDHRAAAPHRHPAAKRRSMSSASPPLAVEANRVDVERLRRYLRDKSPGFDDENQVEQLEGGQSNPTDRVPTQASDYVLRKRPASNLLPSAHMIDRKFAVMRALHGRIPVPNVFRASARALNPATCGQPDGSNHPKQHPLPQPASDIGPHWTPRAGSARPSPPHRPVLQPARYVTTSAMVARASGEPLGSVPM
jgi:hypothetical protein